MSRHGVIQAQAVNLLLIVLMVAIALGGAVFARQQSQRLERVAVETHASLCALKVDVERRHAATEEYIRDVGEGRRELIPGLTLADLRRSMSGHRSTLEALSGLDCQ